MEGADESRSSYNGKLDEVLEWVKEYSLPRRRKTADRISRIRNSRTAAWNGQGPTKKLAFHEGFVTVCSLRMDLEGLRVWGCRVFRV